MVRMSKKNIAKILGNLLSLAAVFFVLKKLFTMDFDVENILSAKNMAICVLLVCVQISTIFTSCFPWIKFVEILADKKIGYKEAMHVYVKANICKYIPGNVFQYVARNEIAMRKQVSNVDVAISTILDTVCSLGIATILSLCLLGNVGIQYIRNSSNSLKFIFIVGVVGVIVVLLLIYMVRGKVKTYLERYKKSINKKNMLEILKIVAYYIYNNIVNSFIFCVLITTVFGCTLSWNEGIVLVGAYLLSLIIGMITPGASGGIGVREAVMIFITQNRYSAELIASVMVALRVISILADIVAYLIVVVLKKMTNKK